MKTYAIFCLVAVTFAVPALASDVTDFGIGVEDGHSVGGDNVAGISLVRGPASMALTPRNAVDFGIGADEGYDHLRGDRGPDARLTAVGTPLPDGVINFGIGIEDGHDCMC